MDIKTKYEENVDVINRGWVVHKLTAICDDTEVGYIKISYIPQKNFNYFYPTIFNYMSQIRGNCGIMEYGTRHMHYRDMTTEAQRVLIRNLWHSCRKFGDLDALSRSIGDEALLPLIQKLEKYFIKYTNQNGLSFKEFEDYNKDKPYVDFIRVHSDYRRKGISKMLYKEMAVILKRQNMILHASGLQTEAAEGVWENMTKLGWVGCEDNGRRYIIL